MGDRESGTRYYVPQLDGLRFVAFLLVFLVHMPRAQGYFPDSPFLEGFFINLRTFAGLGVDLFLVLSAFLITTLLLLEYQREGRVSLKDFFVRRTLRIWPLYYFALLLGFLILPLLDLVPPDFGTPRYDHLVRWHLFPFMVFLGDFSTAFGWYAKSPMLSHLWTISLEEQFYVFWAVMFGLMYRGRGRFLLLATVGLLMFSILARISAVLIPIPHPFIWTALPTRLDPMVFGAGLAFLRFHRPPGRRWWWVKVALGTGLLFLIPLGGPHQKQTLNVVWQYLASAGGFTLLLDAALSGGTFGRILALGPMTELGKVSFGLYVYHRVCISLAEGMLDYSGADGGFEAWLGVLVVGFAATVAVSLVSYRVLERPFLSLKLRFTHVRSRPR